MFVMEYAQGGTLLQHFQTEEFSVSRAQFYAACITLAIEFLHRNNIAYR